MIIVTSLLCILVIVSVFATKGQKSFGIWSLLPPLIAIVLAFMTKQVILSLFLGVLSGTVILEHGNLFHAFLRTLDKYILGALADSWHAGILIFTISIGGMVGIIAKMGGTKAIADALSKKAKTAKSAQVYTFILGVLIFFDDYSNTLIVGPTMRPLTDKMKVSREKLSYIVDSTSAPVAGMALISTWIGYELGLIGDAYKAAGLNVSAYQVFIRTIPFRFYSIFALLMVLLIGVTLRDFGPMYKAEKRARLYGKLLEDDATPMSSLDLETNELNGNKKPKMRNAIIPIVLLVVLGFIGLWYSGGGPDLPFTSEGLRTALGNSDASKALLWAAIFTTIVTIIMAVSQKILTLEKAFEAYVDGSKSLMITAIILILAWSLGSITSDIGTANFLVGAVSNTLPRVFLPLLVFLIACLVSFATGTSWGTMAIIIPLAIPLANAYYQAGAPLSLMYSTLGAVLTGSIFGDHCSPISDTTIMSSMASASDHVDHVKTQIPYALTVAGVAIAVGYIPAGLGLSCWISLILGAIALFLIVKFFGKSTKLEDLKVISAIENSKNETIRG